MKILCSTTIAHNLGDTLIGEGVKRLLRAKYGDFEFLHYNRNPDLQHGSEREARTNLVGDYYQSPELLKHVDMVVALGSPEWCNGPLKALHEGILNIRPEIPYLLLGIGAGHEWVTPSELDKKVLRRPETKIITRSYETTIRLNAFGIQSKAMVCPALFAFDAPSPRPSASARSLLILQAPGRGWHEVPDRILEGAFDALTRIPKEVDLLTVHVKEFERYAAAGFSPRYAGSVQEFARIVSQYSSVVSTRLHGAIGALSLGIPAVVVSDGDYRIETCARMFESGLPIAKTVREALATPVLPVHHQWRDQHWEEWMAALA